MTEVWRRSEKAADAIISDLMDRGGLGNEWEQIDLELRKEIRRVWTGRIRDAFCIYDPEISKDKTP